MIPIECVVRRYLYGSLYSRFKSKNFNIPELRKLLIHLNKETTTSIASKLPFLVFDPTTKSDNHDCPISIDDIIEERMIRYADYALLRNLSLNIYEQMENIIGKSDLILADVKLEFGRDPVNNTILLADSIGPDEYRIWDKQLYTPGRIQDSFDKQILRDWLDGIGFKNTVEKYEDFDSKPPPPKLPEHIIDKISKRYILLLERITKKKFIKESY
jgi:phosphoribosylaminoimidazole-succinocarboxamide synthase